MSRRGLFPIEEATAAGPALSGHSVMRDIFRVFNGERKNCLTAASQRVTRRGTNGNNLTTNGNGPTGEIPATHLWLKRQLQS